MTAELEALERRGWEALSGPNGAEFYAETMADDGLMVFPGIVLDKAGAIDAIRGAPPWASFELSDMRLVTMSDDAGLVAYRAVARRDGQPPYEAQMSSVYTRREERWLLILHQQSPTPQKA